MPITAPWYATGAVPSAAGILLTLAVTIWVTLYAARPRQALYYNLRSARRVTEYDDPALRQVAAGLVHPQVLVIRLRGRGRRDVPSAAFDTGTPIALKTTGRIVLLLRDPESIPGNRSVPPARVTGGLLEIGPGLIGRSQRLTYTVLADVEGTTPWVGHQGSLIDVRMSPRSERFGSLQVTGGLAFFVALVFLVNNGALWRVHGALGRFLDHLAYHDKVTTAVVVADVVFGISLVYLLGSAVSDWLE